MWSTYSQQRIDSLNDTWERLVCAAIVQAVMDLRIPDMESEIYAFFHGPIVSACGFDGDRLMHLAKETLRRKGAI